MARVRVKPPIHYVEKFLFTMGRYISMAVKMRWLERQLRRAGKAGM